MKNGSGIVPPLKKKETHAIFDTLWYLLPVTSEQRREYRSILYRVWGAVLAGELGNVEGVKNPYEGEQHIGSMSMPHQEKCQDFIRHLVRSYHGNISSIAADLSKWSFGFDSRGKTAEVIQSDLDNNTFISSIRQALGIRSYSPMEATHMEAAPPVRMSKAEEMRLEETETIENTIAKMPESEGYTVTSLPARMVKPKKDLTATEHFTEAVIARIEGDADNALIHLDIAASRNHAEAAWYMWEYLDKSSQTPNEKREALEYLDIACRGLYWLAPLKVKALYRGNPSITTPYLDQLQSQAKQAGASSATINTLGEYYTYILDDVVKGEACYKQAIAKDSNADALLNLHALYAGQKEWFFVSEEDHDANCNYIKLNAPVNSKAHFMLERQGIKKALYHFKDTQNNTEITKTVTEAMSNGSVAATIVYHVGCLKPRNHKKGPHKANADQSLQYLSNIVRYTLGSAGNDSDYNIDYTSAYTDKKATSAQDSIVAIPTLIEYYKTNNDSKNLQYWETYLQCNGGEITATFTVSEAEERQISIFIGALMGNGVKSAYKPDSASTRVTALLPASIDPSQKQRAILRLKQHNIAVRQEEDGSVRIPETTYLALKEAYSVMMRAHQARNTIPVPEIIGSALVSDTRNGQQVSHKNPRLL